MEKMNIDNLIILGERVLIRKSVKAEENEKVIATTSNNTRSLEHGQIVKVSEDAQNKMNLFPDMMAIYSFYAKEDIDDIHAFLDIEHILALYQPMSGASAQPTDLIETINEVVE